MAEEAAEKIGTYCAYRKRANFPAWHIRKCASPAR